MRTIVQLLAPLEHRLQHAQQLEQRLRLVGSAHVALAVKDAAVEVAGVEGAQWHVAIAPVGVARIQHIGEVLHGQRVQKV